MEISKTTTDYIMLYFKKIDYYNTIISNLPSKNKTKSMPDWNIYNQAIWGIKDKNWLCYKIPGPKLLCLGH